MYHIIYHLSDSNLLSLVVNAYATAAEITGEIFYARLHVRYANKNTRIFRKEDIYIKIFKLPTGKANKIYEKKSPKE